MKLILSLLTIILLAGCAAKPQATEAIPETQTEMQTETESEIQTNSTTELNIFTWAGYVPDKIVSDFEESTGISVNYTNFETNEEMLSKLKAQSNEFDIIICSDYIIPIMNEEGLLSEIDTSKINNFKNIDSEYQNSYYDPDNKLTIPYTAATEIIVYDSTKVSEPLTGYNDFWREEFLNKLVVLDGDRDIIGMTAMSLGYSVNETDEDKLSEIKEKLIALKPNIITFSVDAPHNSIINGDANAGLMFGSQYVAAKEEVPTLEFVYPEEGMVFYVDNIVLPKSTPNTENAYKFMDYILDGEVSADISMLINYPNCNIAAKEFLSDEYLDNKAVNIDRELVNNPQAIQDIGETSVIYNEIWTEFKSR